MNANITFKFGEKTLQFDPSHPINNVGMFKGKIEVKVEKIGLEQFKKMAEQLQRLHRLPDGQPLKDDFFASVEEAKRLWVHVNYSGSKMEKQAKLIEKWMGHSADLSADELGKQIGEEIKLYELSYSLKKLKIRASKHHPESRSFDELNALVSTLVPSGRMGKLQTRQIIAFWKKMVVKAACFTDKTNEYGVTEIKPAYEKILLHKLNGFHKGDNFVAFCKALSEKVIEPLKKESNLSHDEEEKVTKRLLSLAALAGKAAIENNDWGARPLLIGLEDRNLWNVLTRIPSCCMRELLIPRTLRLAAITLSRYRKARQVKVGLRQLESRLKTQFKAHQNSIGTVVNDIFEKLNPKAPIGVVVEKKGLHLDPARKIEQILEINSKRLVHLALRTAEVAVLPLVVMGLGFLVATFAPPLVPIFLAAVILPLFSVIVKAFDGNHPNGVLDWIQEKVFGGGEINIDFLIENMSWLFYLGSILFFGIGGTMLFSNATKKSVRALGFVGNILFLSGFLSLIGTTFCSGLTEEMFWKDDHDTYVQKHLINPVAEKLNLLLNQLFGCIDGFCPSPAG